MKPTYSPEEVAEAHLPAEWKDKSRWMKRRLASGEIPGKQISRGVWLMTDADIEAWLTDRDTPAPVADEPVAEPVSFAAGLSERARRRLAS